MKRWMILLAAGLAVSRVLAGWETLTSTRLDPSRMVEVAQPNPVEMWFPVEAFLPECTEFTLLASIRNVATTNYVEELEIHGSMQYAIFAGATVSVDRAQATTEGGPELEEEQPWNYNTPLTLNANGQFSYANALPANISWNHYGDRSQGEPTVLCVNIETDSDLTLMIGAEEFEIEADIGRQRFNVELTTGDRSVSVAAASANATVKLGWATLPWIEFFDGGVIPNNSYGNFTDYQPYLYPNKPFVMFAFRGKIENNTLTTSFGFLTVTNEFWEVTTNHSVDANHFAKNSRARIVQSVPGGFDFEIDGERAWLMVGTYGAKLMDKWLTDSEIRRIADQDFKELHRRGYEFPGVSNEYWEQMQ